MAAIGPGRHHGRLRAWLLPYVIVDDRLVVADEDAGSIRTLYFPARHR